MADVNTDKPLADLAAAEESLNEPAVYRGIKDGAVLHTETVTISGNTAAAARLRAFEDEHFGEDAVRIDGQVERGSGSAYQMMSEPRQKHYRALEHAVEVELKVDAARAQLSAAEGDMAAAEAEIDRAAADVEKAEDEQADGRK